MTPYWYFIYFYECQISTYMNMLCDKMSWQETDAKFRLKVRVPTARLRGFATGRGDVAGTLADNGLLNASKIHWKLMNIIDTLNICFQTIPNQ